MVWRFVLLISCISLAGVSCSNSDLGIDNYRRLAGKDNRNTILVTLDGVRWNEFFYGIDESIEDACTIENREVFGSFWRKWGDQGIAIGDRLNSSQMGTSTFANLSLPSYQSIFSGKSVGCFSNQCSRIANPSFAQNIKTSLGLQDEDVAIYASWETMKLAVENVEGSLFVNTGLKNVAGESDDSFLQQINHLQNDDKPLWGEARYDKYTFALAMRHLQKHKPRFLFIGLNDSDEWAHRNDYPRYIETLRQYSTWLDELFSTLSSMKNYGDNTLVIVTTDHGRGLVKNFHGHWALQSSSSHVWLYARGPSINQLGRLKHHQPETHALIRPLIELNHGLDGNGQYSHRSLFEEILNPF